MAIALPVNAKDSLGVFSDWGAFRDPQMPRCYAIAMAHPDNRKHDYAPYASIGTWPRQGVRNQLHIRLSRKLEGHSAVTLTVGRSDRFTLAGGGGDAWAQDKRMDAAIIAAMRSAGEMVVTSRDAAGRIFSDIYSLGGAATAIDAATVGCARMR